MSAPRALPQSKEALTLKAYTARMKEDLKSMLENFEGNFLNIFVYIQQNQIFKPLTFSNRNIKTCKR